MQWNLTSQAHQMAVGASWDQARMRFVQTQQLGSLNDSRGIDNLLDVEEETACGAPPARPACSPPIPGRSPCSAPDRLGPLQHMSRVTTHFDELTLTAPNLDGDHSYRKLNPASA